MLRSLKESEVFSICELEKPEYWLYAKRVKCSPVKKIWRSFTKLCNGVACGEIYLYIMKGTNVYTLCEQKFASYDHHLMLYGRWKIRFQLMREPAELYHCRGASHRLTPNICGESRMSVSPWPFVVSKTYALFRVIRRPKRLVSIKPVVTYTGWCSTLVYHLETTLGLTIMSIKACYN